MGGRNALIYILLWNMNLIMTAVQIHHMFCTNGIVQSLKQVKVM